MSLWRPTCRATAASLAAVVALAPVLASPPTIVVDSDKFEFRVPALSGGTLSNEDFKGRIVVVDVWATWCGPCRMVIPHLVKLSEKFKGSGVTVVGLNADEDGASGPGLESVKRFVHQYGITYPIGLMNARAYVELARVMGTSEDGGLAIPATVVLGRDGAIVKRYPGYFPGQEREIEQIVTRMIGSSAEPPKRP